jgi:hypothetical protein
MKIDITKEEYRNLLDVLHMADWMMHAHETEEDPGTVKYDEVIQKFYALAKDLGHDDSVKYNPEARKYFVTREFDSTSESWEFIDDFTDVTFWDELIHRLTDRDIARTVGGYEQLDKLSMEQRFVHEAPIIKKYSQEFDERGLDRLELVEQFGQALASRTRTHD